MWVVSFFRCTTGFNEKKWLRNKRQLKSGKTSIWNDSFLLQKYIATFLSHWEKHRKLTHKQRTPGNFQRSDLSNFVYMLRRLFRLPYSKNFEAKINQSARVRISKVHTSDDSSVKYGPIDSMPYESWLNSWIFFSHHFIRMSWISISIVFIFRRSILSNRRVRTETGDDSWTWKWTVIWRYWRSWLIPFGSDFSLRRSSLEISLIFEFICWISPLAI